MQSRKLTIAAAGAATLLLTSCAGAGDVEDTGSSELDVAPGVTEDTVVIGSHQPLTGPAAPGYLQISIGAGAVYDYINENGGVHGREIEYVVEDDGYDPTRTVEVTRDLVLREEIFAMVGGLGTPTHSKVLDFLNEEGVPDLFVSSGALMWNQPEEYPLTYGYQVDYTKESKVQGAFIAENFPDAKVGYLQQNDDVGTDSRAGLDQYLSDNVVSQQSYESSSTNISPQMAELKDAGVEVLVCSCIPAFTALAMLEAQAIDWQPQFVVSSIGADTATLMGLLKEFGGENLPADQMLDGMISTGYLPQITMSDDPWITFYRKVHEEMGVEEPFTNTMLYGMVQATQFARALEAAGPEPTRQSLLDAVNSNDFSGPGLVPFVATEDDHAGYDGAFVSQFNAGGTPEILQEPMVTDRGEGPLESFDLERPTPREIDILTE
ncbi:ABC transporter substrate-binding protein [Salinactinospora qingdaonensis]|uniref:ABC transporter substrate-binding protein n=1 Tax=Salinactinospora qingdaonensis TaxID=702744 RepID=A0ABP7GQC7_9ACTN